MCYVRFYRISASFWNLMRRWFASSESHLVRFSNHNYEILPADQKVEEEFHDAITQRRYYPVQIGDTIIEKYQILGKLGFGVGSTVWLANDYRAQQTVALKIFTNDVQNREEVKIYKHLLSMQSEHPGCDFIRKALDSFIIHGPKGEHHCLVHEPMLESTQELLRRHASRPFTEDLLRQFLRHLLIALDYLHSETHLIHTDISAWNILLGIEDKSIIQKFVEAEQKYPSPRKVMDGYTVYATREFENPDGDVGQPLLCDFGSAVSGDVEHDEDVQPDVYRAPEVCIKAPWSYAIDIWNVGCLIWDLFEGKHLFYGKDPKEEKYLTRAHLAEMVALMGPPPPDFLKAGKRSAEFFDENGIWRADIPMPKRTSLEESEERLEGSNKETFLDFVRKMIQWRPEDRQTARQLLESDEWLNAERAVLVAVH